MYIDFTSWLAQGGGLVRTQIALRASVQQFRAEDKPTDVVLVRQGTKLIPQEVRIEYDDSVAEQDNEQTGGFRRRAIIFGIQGHPTLDDTDIQMWDTFSMDGQEFTVMHVNRQLIGQIQATCEAIA